MLNLIFIVTMYPVLFLMWFLIKNAAKSSRNTLFGIRCSREWLSGEEEARFLKEFHHKMKRYLLILALVPFTTFLIPYVSVSFSIWMMWLLAVIVLIMFPFAQSNRKLLALKQERCRTPGEDTQGLQNGALLYFEPNGAGQLRCLKWYDFAGPLAISALLCAGSFFLFYGEKMEAFCFIILSFALCTPLFYIFAILMDRMKTKVISNNSDINVDYARAGKNIWRKFWICSAWMNTAVTAALTLITYLQTVEDNISINAVLWISVLYGLAMVAVAGNTCAKMQKVSAAYQDRTDLAYDADEAAWIGGIIYYNPADKQTMVANKIGTGTSINMATFAGKICGIIACIALLSLPISCIWLTLEEFTPISLTVSDGQVTARHLKTDYLINTSAIRDISLTTEVPKSSRTNGTSMEHLLKGNFRNKTDGRVKLFLNPQNGIFLRIETEDAIYYMSGYDDEETGSVYELLTGQPLSPEYR